MSVIQQLGVTTKLSNCELTRVDIDDEHYYFLGDQFAVSLTRVLDIGAPFPEGLRDWLRRTDQQDSTEYMMMTRDRGSKLHDALERLANGLELDLTKDYGTQYEKDAIVTFVRFFRFLQPKNFKTELVVADPKLRVAGTLDFVGYADERRLNILLEPLKYLDVEDDQYVLKEKFADMLAGEGTLTKFVIDYKFTGRSAYNHKVQIAGYEHMYNQSYDDAPVTRKFTWRYSAKHKHRFDLQESLLKYDSFTRIYQTFLDYLANAAGRNWTGFPEPPKLVVYPEKVRLFEPVKKESA